MAKSCRWSVCGSSPTSDKEVATAALVVDTDLKRKSASTCLEKTLFAAVNTCMKEEASSKIQRSHSGSFFITLAPSARRAPTLGCECEVREVHRQSLTLQIGAAGNRYAPACQDSSAHIQLGVHLKVILRKIGP
eukprot:1722076-Amphidinium_carterae.2